MDDNFQLNHNLCSIVIPTIAFFMLCYLPEIIKLKQRGFAHLKPARFVKIAYDFLYCSLKSLSFLMFFLKIRLKKDNPILKLYQHSFASLFQILSRTHEHNRDAL